MNVKNFLNMFIVAENTGSVKSITCKIINIVAAFRGMHVSPAKHSYV